MNKLLTYFFAAPAALLSQPHGAGSDVESKLKKNQCYIGGAWRDAGNGKTFAVTDPATGLKLGDVPDCGRTEAAEAIEAAHRAQPAWAALSAYDRAKFLRQLAELMLQRRDELARLLTAEQGKPLGEASREIAYSASFLEWFAEESKRVYGQTIPASSPTQRLMVTKQPVGVCAAITPWNFPSAMITRKMGAALAAGCTMICKPAPETPYSALAIAALCEEIKLPRGVFNVITGNAEAICGAFMESPAVRKITFTGSTEVGKILIRQSADTIKRLTMELGGNAPFIVFDDADLDRAAEDAIFAKYRNAGQTCVCVNRFLIHESVHDEFLKKLTARSSTLKVGPGTDEGVEIGPLINRAAVEKIGRLLADAKALGAKFAMGEPPGESLFVGPTILTGLSSKMAIAREEIFGPICAVWSFRDEDEAVELANATHAGLASYIYTAGLSRALRISERLQYGMVGINTSMISNAQAPFGGIKQSGFGREGGSQGIEEYLDMKYVAIGL